MKTLGGGAKGYFFEFPMSHSSDSPVNKTTGNNSREAMIRLPFHNAIVAER